MLNYDDVIHNAYVREQSLRLFQLSINIIDLILLMSVIIIDFNLINYCQ